MDCGVKMNLFIGGSFFLSEITIIWICYKFIYKKKNTSNRFFWDFFRMLIGYYLFVLKYRFQSSMRNCEMDDFLQQYSELRYSIFEKSALGIVEIIALPFIVVFMIRCFSFLGVPFLIYIAGLGVFLENLKESRIALMVLLNESQKFLFKFDRRKKYMRREETAEREKHRTLEKQQKEKSRMLKIFIVLLMIACADITMILVLRDMLREVVSRAVHLKDTVYLSPFFIVMVFITLLLYTIFRLLDEKFRNNLKQRRSYRKQLKANNEIKVWGMNENMEELSGWFDEILNMCCLLHIKEVKIGIDDLDTKKAVSVILEGQMPVIIIGREVFAKSQRYAPQIHYGIIKLLFAHELVHIHYNDIKWMRKVSGIVLLYIGFSLFVMYLAFKSQNAVILGIAVFLVLNYFVFHKMCDERYWKQVMEFRADRIGMAVSNIPPAILEEALRCTAEGEINDEKKIDTGILYRIYQKRVEQQVHPGIKRRIYEAKREKPWSFREYFRYLWLISWNVTTRKGWKI